MFTAQPIPLKMINVSRKKIELCVHSSQWNNFYSIALLPFDQERLAPYICMRIWMNKNSLFVR